MCPMGRPAVMSIQFKTGSLQLLEGANGGPAIASRDD